VLRSLEWEIPEFELVHVKLKRLFDRKGDRRGLAELDLAELEAMIEPSGPPSCIECSKLIVSDHRVDAIWLFHRAGVRVAEGTATHDERDAGRRTADALGLEHPPGGPAGWSELPAGWRRWPSAAFHRETLAQCQVHPRTPAQRGTADYPCESCGNTTTGSTRDERGFMRCNVCGYPSP
jgi:hypothetical protein